MPVIFSLEKSVHFKCRGTQTLLSYRERERASSSFPHPSFPSLFTAFTSYRSAPYPYSVPLYLLPPQSTSSTSSLSIVFSSLFFCTQLDLFFFFLFHLPAYECAGVICLFIRFLLSCVIIIIFCVCRDGIRGEGLGLVPGPPSPRRRMVRGFGHQ